MIWLVVCSSRFPHFTEAFEAARSTESPELALRSSGSLRVISWIVSACSSDLPQALSYQWDIAIQTFGPELDCSLLLGTHISSHQQLSYFKPIVKALFRLLTIEKA